VLCPVLVPEMIKSLEHLLCEERLRPLGQFSLERQRLRRDIISSYKYLKEGFKEDGARLFSVVTRDNGHELKHRRFHLNISKHFFTMRVTKHWHMLPRDIVESPSSETFKSCLGVVLGSLL